MACRWGHNAPYVVPWRGCRSAGAISDSTAQMALVDQYLSLVTGHARAIMPEDVPHLTGPGDWQSSFTYAHAGIHISTHPTSKRSRRMPRAMP